MYLQCLGFA